MARTGCAMIDRRGGDRARVEARGDDGVMDAMREVVLARLAEGLPSGRAAAASPRLARARPARQRTSAAAPG